MFSFIQNSQAADREEWRDDGCDENLAAFDINYGKEANVRRVRRHTATSVPAIGPCRYICGSVCASDFGLRVTFGAIARH